MQGRSLSSFLPLVADVLEYKYKDRDAADIIRAAHKELKCRDAHNPETAPIQEREKQKKKDLATSGKPSSVSLTDILADIPEYPGKGLRILPIDALAVDRKGTEFEAAMNNPRFFSGHLLTEEEMRDMLTFKSDKE